MSIIHCENNLSPRLRALFARLPPRAPFPLVRASEIGYPPWGIEGGSPWTRACMRVTRACVVRAGGGRVRVMRAGGARVRVERARRALGGWAWAGGVRVRGREGGGGALRCGRRGRRGDYRGDGGLPEHGTPSSRPRAPTAGGWARARRGRAGRAARSLGRRGRAAGRGVGVLVPGVRRMGGAWAAARARLPAVRVAGGGRRRAAPLVRGDRSGVRSPAAARVARRPLMRSDLRLC